MHMLLRFTNYIVFLFCFVFFVFCFFSCKSSYKSFVLYKTRGHICTERGLPVNGSSQMRDSTVYHFLWQNEQVFIPGRVHTKLEDLAKFDALFLTMWV